MSLMVSECSSTIKRRKKYCGLERITDLVLVFFYQIEIANVALFLASGEFVYS